MYKIELQEDKKILISKEFLKYIDLVNCVDELLKQMGLGRQVIIYEKKNDKWAKFGEWRAR